MNSKLAYVHFTQDIGMSDVNVAGEIIQLNNPIYAGQTDLMSVADFMMFKKDFPDRVEGEIIKEDNLLNVVNTLYAKLKEEIAELPELSEYTQTRYDYLKSQFEVNGVLKPDHNTVESINDLANKYYILQEQVRIDQVNYRRKQGMHK